MKSAPYAVHNDPLAPYDAVLLVSYGGPNGPDDVLPFMRNATGGAGIPDERLVEVSGHYQRFGGVSPINARNAELCEALNARFAELGSKVRIEVGNRNWHPYFAETLAQQISGGARRILTLFTTAYTSYSGCRQYRENLAAALEEVGATADIAEVSLDRVRPFANTDGFIEANAAQILQAWQDLGDREGRVVLVTHSIPLSMARASGPGAAQPDQPKPALFEDGLKPSADMSTRVGNELSPAAMSALLPETAEQDALGEGWTYLAQHLAVGAAIMDKVSQRAGQPIPFDLAFCSRSGPPQAKWLEPDVNDHLEALAAKGVKSVVVAPIGFVSDHMEVVFDLDTEAAQTAADLGMNYRRAGTAGTHRAIVDQLVDLVLERAAQARGEAVELPVAAGTFPAWGETCGDGCCQYPRVRRGAGHPGSHPHSGGAGQHPGAHFGGTQNEKKAGNAMARPGRPFIPAPEITGDPRDSVVVPEEVNARDNFSLHMVFKQTAPLSEAEAAALDEAVKATGVDLRGWYDVAGFRADADLMAWVLADSAEACQAAFREVLKTGKFEQVWTAMSRHIPAEFDPNHLPACFGGFGPRNYMAIYPFVRSYDWYYLPAARRGAILREHGMNGRGYTDTPISTLAAFALGDWEWTVTIEGDSLERIMGVLRKQRETEARLFVRVDTPFYTGPRVELTDWAKARA